MATSDVNLADRSGNLLESHKGYDPRVVFFYFLLAALVLTLVGGLAYQQLTKSGTYSEKERLQTQRRVIVPGPRGNIYDREGRLLATNRPVFSVVLYVDELRPELRREQLRIRKNYFEMNEKDMPSRTQFEQISRVAVAQHYLDTVIRILRRDPNSPEATIDAKKLGQHFSRSLLLPYTLLDDLSGEDYARLLEELPVAGPLQVYTASARFYPFKNSAAHVLGTVKMKEDTEVEDFPGEDLHTFTTKAASGDTGLEKQFDEILQGTPGGAIIRVDPSGYRIKKPIEQRLPRQGQSITTSLDIDLQQVVDDEIKAFDDDKESKDGPTRAAVVALDVATGEVLVMTSKPDYDVNTVSPRATRVAFDKVTADSAWLNLATSGSYPPGSTFKTIVSIAGMRTGRLDPSDMAVECTGHLQIGRKTLGCDNGLGHHGRLDLAHALAESCDTYYWYHGVYDIGVAAIAAEARRFHLGQKTGIELPNETRYTIVPDPAWKKEKRSELGPWSDGDTANVAIGQGDLLVTPLQMACLAASLARGEVWTQPTLLHDPARPRQHQESIGLTPQQRAILVDGMVGCTTYGTASALTTIANLQIPGVKIAGKTGTAQKKVTIGDKTGNINFAWFICFAPADNPQIAMAVMVEGDTIGENFAGGSKAGPIAAKIVRRYLDKKRASAAPTGSSLMKSVVTSP